MVGRTYQGRYLLLNRMVNWTLTSWFNREALSPIFRITLEKYRRDHNTGCCRGCVITTGPAEEEGRAGVQRAGSTLAIQLAAFYEVTLEPSVSPLNMLSNYCVYLLCLPGDCETLIKITLNRSLQRLHSE